MFQKRKSRSRISGINRLTTGRKMHVVLVFLLAQAMFFYSDCFKLHHLTVHGYHKLSRAQVVDATGLYVKQHPHRTEFRLDAVQGRVRELLWVRQAQVTWHFPGELEVDVVERSPVVLAAQDDGRPGIKHGAWRDLTWCAVDPDGIVLEPVSGPQAGGLPRLLLERPVRPGRKVSVAAIDKVLQWAPVLKHACGNSIAYFQVDPMGQVSFVTPLVHRPTLVRIGAPEKEFKVQVLRMLCERIEREGRPVDYVDLRFAYPAIRYPGPVALKQKSGGAEGKAAAGAPVPAHR